MNLDNYQKGRQVNKCVRLHSHMSVSIERYYLDLRPTQQEENHGWYWKQSQLPGTSEVTLGKNLLWSLY